MAAEAILVWVRRELRLGDHPALAEAAATGRPVVPVFLCDETVEARGAAAQWRLGLGVAAFAEALAGAGSRLVLRRGGAAAALVALAREAEAGEVWWSRAHEPVAAALERDVAGALAAEGIGTRAFEGHVLFPPESVATKTGGYYKVYTPFWKSVRDRDVGTPLPPPKRLTAPGRWPESERLEAWGLGAEMRRGADVVAEHVVVGEAAAARRLERFVEERLADYPQARNRFDVEGTSGLSENLAVGEISARSCWQAGLMARDAGNPGAETFLKEVAWRDFAYHLLHHTPRLATDNWRPEWAAFPWNTDEDAPEVVAWQRGRTGVALVDAAMREMYVTGRMHNRGRMIVGSYLTKHLLSHWRIGQRWFDAHLTDWDPANNALGWQWVAGSGPDASPFFRVFNPDGQAEKFDPDGAYRRKWVAEGQDDPPATALAYFAAIPRKWSMSADDPYPQPVVGLAEGRARALAAYKGRQDADAAGG
ncbi:deoxyribodipyrimidine photolyase [Oceanicola granulosus HTCC2516]|uniref:Deoxyribodipyrimidine photolyase n=1 Tax=Oceanicola granulosus (strain ATCC BAA-861 / DSM 15982 / KCTC 12143 / HTCC2516) TaxID=314256 RepID=Q2CFF7_OCEGH|nr:deoxyribodipyrimidine photo-lyase [Oceanicola granulosus]EAR51338.1 deoxyribodipyrimidine photolyase [Oceanicola granulosus HTCC2516]